VSNKCAGSLNQRLCDSVIPRAEFCRWQVKRNSYNQPTLFSFDTESILTIHLEKKVHFCSISGNICHCNAGGGYFLQANLTLFCGVAFALLPLVLTWLDITD